MKTVYLIRHSKSSWSNPDCIDFERDINSRGKKDAKLMSEKLSEHTSTIDLVLSSEAHRARQTTEILFSEDVIKQSKVVFEKKLYHISSTDLLKRLSELDDALNTVAVVAHNPGLTDLANLFSNVTIDNMPTSGVLAVEFDIKKWSKILKTEGSLLFFDYPKNYKVFK